MEEEQIIHDEQQEEAPIWGKLENLFSGCLAFILLIALPFLFYGLIELLPQGDDPTDPSKTQLEIRQEALEGNWEKFLDRANASGIQIQTENFELSLCPFVGDDAWDEVEDPEEVGLICGYITVPLDHLQPTGEVLQIPIAIWPSYDEDFKPDPVVMTHGGPGGSGLVYFPGSYYPEWGPGLRDLVFVDQRGTRYAKPNLLCPEITEDVYGAINPDQEDEYDFQDELNYCRARLAGKGITLSAFTTPQIARDFEVVRKTFGYEQINFYGVSYGTHVGQYLAAYYPESIRSLILDGVAPIPLDYLNRSVSTRTRILNELFDSCDQNPLCTEYYPDLSQRLSDLINSLDKDPVTVRFGFDYRFYPLEVDGEFFFNYLLSIAYMDHNYAVLPYIIKEAENNRFDYFKAWVDWRVSDVSERSLAYYAVICSEHQPFQPIDQGSLDLGIPIINWENSDLEEFEETCRELGLQHTPDTLEILSDSTIPTLLLSGLFDPITPPSYGETALRSFSNGQHVIDPLGSHGYALYDDCPAFIMHQFLKNPLVDVDSTCLENPERREDVVPPTALSSFFMLTDKNIPEDLFFLPVCMALLVIPRYTIQGVTWVWKKIKKSPISKPDLVKKIRLRFELSNWVFGLCTFGLGFGLDKYNATLRPYIYRHALALPEEARYLLLIPLITLLLAPLLAYFSFRVWKNNKSVLNRLYLLVNFAFVLIISGTMVLNGMVWIWAR